MNFSIKMDGCSELVQSKSGSFYQRELKHIEPHFTQNSFTNQTPKNNPADRTNAGRDAFENSVKLGKTEFAGKNKQTFT